ncbi:MAG: 30S ribosomal protein S8 [Candidatus Woesearchaeota archaeon]
MVLNDPLATMLSKIHNANKVNKDEVIIKPVSKFMIKIVEILQKHNYIKEFEVVKDGRGDHLIIKGFEMINKCGAIKPRFSFTALDAVLVEQDYLPAKGFGIIIVTTSKGLMTIEKAQEENVGGKLVAYCY